MLCNVLFICEVLLKADWQAIDLMQHINANDIDLLTLMPYRLVLNNFDFSFIDRITYIGDMWNSVVSTLFVNHFQQAYMYQ